MGAENLTKPVIQAAIQREFEQRSERTHVTQDLVVAKLWSTFLSATLDGSWSPAVRALEVLGKHLGMFGPKGTEDDPLYMQMKMLQELDLTKLTDKELDELSVHAAAIEQHVPLALPPPASDRPTGADSE